jgi:hypothetical protein
MGPASSVAAVLIDLLLCLGDTSLTILIREAYDFTLGRQVAFYTPLLQFCKVALRGDAVFLVNPGKFPGLLLDGFLFLLFGAAFFKGIELLLQSLLFVVNGFF